MKRLVLALGLIVLVAGSLMAENAGLTPEEALAQIQDYKSKTEALNSEIQSLQSTLESLRNEVQVLDTQINQLKEEINSLKAEIAKYPSEYEVQPGDYLAKIAAMRYIYNNAKAWPRIYRANRDKIKNPNLIYPGWVLKIPHGIVKEIEVIPGDCLWKIAGFYWIYNDPLQWPRIYKANKDKIKDPDLIYPGQVLTIPRD
ncbi:MAG: hypothetical protein DRQ10_05145 [Candidatus Hydrothermota bacterium]|nr:MAG: hypothetical protein DRQ10_05145 [Candidatus Hydrothermae bacterium]